MVLNKLSNDAILLGKVITNGHLPYYNWTYPTNSSNDFALRSGALISTELYEVSSASLSSKCVSTNVSCVLLIGVTSNAPTNTTTSISTLRYLSSRNRLDLQSLTNDFIS